VLASGDLCLTLGAGDLTTLPDELLSGPWGAADREPGQGADGPTANAPRPARDERRRRS
jgi:hypothetical protein